jgi:preprotein translocase subunit SecA
MDILKKIFGDPNERVIKAMLPIVEAVNALEGEISALSPEALKDRSLELKAKVMAGQVELDDVLPEAFALCREAAKRTMGQRHYDVQIMGGIALHRGQIAEMRTGEGKTLTATLAVYLNALTGKGVHVVTVNDYLARRDCAWMSQVYAYLGVSSACINHDIAYLYDATWKLPPEEPEVTGADLAAASAKEEGGTVDEKRDETGAFRVAVDFLRPVPRAEAYNADITYGTNNEYGFDYLRDNMVVRPEQRAQRPLHYAIIDEVDSILIDEARTPLIISAAAEEAADIYYQFAELVERLTEEAGDYNKDEKMRSATLTDQGIDKLEDWLGVKNIYELGSVTQVHHIEQALMAKVFYRRDRDYVVRNGEVIIIDEFTGRLMFGRRFSEGLHQAIEARESKIFGSDVKIQRESQTLATVTFQNLFRMYHKLSGMTGTAATEAEEFSKIYKLEVTAIPPNRVSVRKDLPDRIYRNEIAKFNAVVQEVKARHATGQPVLVGTISPEKNEIVSELLRREGVPHSRLDAKNHEGEGQTIAQAGRLGSVTIATNMAGRGVDIILGGNPPDAEAAKKVRDLGGLMVIGTERHESRRIDNQLRGRAGRQGDPGNTLFFVSMEDDLMRIFAGEDRMQSMRNMMERLGIPDDMPIEHSMVSKSLESAQHKVEGNHFDVRKHLLEYDDVLAKHREVIYKRRLEALDIPLDRQDVVRTLLLGMVESELERVVRFHTATEHEEQWNLKEIYEVAGTIFPFAEESRRDLGELRAAEHSKREDAAARGRIIDYLMERATEAYDALEKQTLKDVDGNVAFFVDLMRGMVLRSIDTHWVEHLDSMEHLRTGIGLQGYGQRDPLVEYKREAYRKFQELLQVIERQVVYSFYKVRIVREVPQQAQSLMDRRGVTLSGAAKESGSDGTSETAVTSGQPKVGRNEPCPCGSGKKYKKCHGA